MLRDRSAFLGARGLLPRGIESPEPPFCSGASLAPCSSGTVGPVPLPLFLLGTE